MDVSEEALQNAQGWTWREAGESVLFKKVEKELLRLDKHDPPAARELRSLLARTYKTFSEGSERSAAFLIRKLFIVLEKEEHPKNPYETFKRELWDYYLALLEFGDYARLDGEARYALIDKIKRHKRAFIRRVLGLWHGDEQYPGIVRMLDKKLGSKEEVQAFKIAFTKGSSWHNPWIIEFLSPECRDGDEMYRLDMTYGFDNNLISSVKQEFFEYDFKEMFDRLSLPADVEQCLKQATIQTSSWRRPPIGWFPYETNTIWASLFHGTSSVALPSILQERRLWCAAELRERGVQKLTGEGGPGNGGYTPNSISCVKSFTHALYWAERESNNRIAGFPLVIGASRSVMSRATYGTQPGEIEVENHLNLDGEEITHLYVPKRETHSVNEMLAAAKVSGIRVVSFSEMGAPPKCSLPTKTHERTETGPRSIAVRLSKKVDLTHFLEMLRSVLTIDFPPEEMMKIEDRIAEAIAQTYVSAPEKLLKLEKALVEYYPFSVSRRSENQLRVTLKEGATYDVEII